MQLTASEILRLENQGCFSTDWTEVTIAPGSDLSLLRAVRFMGKTSIGMLRKQPGRPTGIFNAVIADCTIGDNPYISNIHGELRGLRIANNVTIENVGRITCEQEAPCGLGVPVAVLDETGSRPVPLFPTLTSQLASLMARNPRLAEYHILPMLKDAWEHEPTGSLIGDGVTIRDAGCLRNLRIDPGVTIEGASRLINGRIINNAPAEPLAYVGAGVDAENFMIVDGRVDTGAMLRNVFVGQGVEIDKYFSAHDSLFFANSSCECGEACAIIAGPYTVTMHKSTLLIGAEYSFMNAGSGTNSSNHMYKLGPVHHGLMQRGVKTASSSYMMWEGRIGAFSLLMGQHKTHPDTTPFPFSYLFGTPEGKTVVAPALMLRSCGLDRDKVKWPARDRRTPARLPLMDHLHFDVLNPLTVSTMLDALRLIDEISRLSPEPDGYIHHGGLLFSPSALSRGRDIYTRAIVVYLQRVTSRPTPDTTGLTTPESWIDLGGQIIPGDITAKVRECETISQVNELIDNAFLHYPALEYLYVQTLLTPEWQQRLADADTYTIPFYADIEADRTRALSALTR